MEYSRKEILIALGITFGIIVVCVVIAILGVNTFLRQPEVQETPTLAPNQPTNTPKPEPQNQPPESNSSEGREPLGFSLENTYLFKNPVESMLCVFTIVILIVLIFILDSYTRRRRKNKRNNHNNHNDR